MEILEAKISNLCDILSSINLYCSGLWSLLAVAVFVQEYDPQSLCNVHAAFEGLCYCNLRLPCLVSNRNTHQLTETCTFFNV